VPGNDLISSHNYLPKSLSRLARLSNLHALLSSFISANFHNILRWQTLQQRHLRQREVVLVEEAEEVTEEEEVADEEGEDQSEMKRRNGFQSLNSVVLSELGKSNPWRYSRSHSLEYRLMMVRKSTYILCQSRNTKLSTFSFLN